MHPTIINVAKMPSGSPIADFSNGAFFVDSKQFEGRKSMKKILSKLGCGGCLVVPFIGLLLIGICFV